VSRRAAPAALAALVVAGLALGGAARASAQQDAAAVADRTALHLSAGALVPQAAPLVEAGVGRFLGDRVEVGVREEAGFATGRGPHDWHLATMPFVDVFAAGDPKWLLTPFAGLAGGVIHDDRRATGTLGPEAGVALFLSDTVLLSARYQFRWAAERVGGVPTDGHTALLGVALLLGGDDRELARAEASAARAEEAAARAEQSVDRLEHAVDRLERAVDAYERWFEQQLRK
jgi:hypothetical protein